MQEQQIGHCLQEKEIDLIIVKILTAAPWWTTQQRPEPIWEGLMIFQNQQLSAASD